MSINATLRPCCAAATAIWTADRWGDRRAAALPVVLTVPPSRLATELQRCADAGGAGRGQGGRPCATLPTVRAGR